MKKFTRSVASLLCAVTLILSASVVFAAPVMDEGTLASKLFDAYMDFIVDNYKYDITKEELLEKALDGFLKENPQYLEQLSAYAFDTLDANSRFYTKEEYESVYSDVSGVYVGIGINIHLDNNTIILGEPIKGAPADGSGLKVGDVVVAVDGVDVSGYSLDKVTSLIKGEEGTTTKITVKRNGQPYTYEIKRAKIKLQSVTYNIIEGTDVGYIKISSFNASTSEGFEEAAKFMGENGVKNIVLDLRNNLGGYLSAAVDVASYFVPNKALVVTAERKDTKKNTKYYANKTPYKFRAAVLINEYSASASEVVSSVIHDYKSGVLVGKRSFGKGTVQEPAMTALGQCLWLTTAEYFTPSHTEIHEVGIKPDYHVRNTIEKYDISKITKYDILRVLKVGDTGTDVYAVKERLNALGYKITVDDVYDVDTAAVVTRFQSDTGLYPYGVADLTTQVKIYDVLINTRVEVDNQLEKATELAKNNFR